MSLNLNANALSHVGKVRANNQDSGYAGIDLFVVADGMGGYAGGDIASAAAISVLKDLDHSYSPDENIEEIITESVLRANREIVQLVEERPNLARMGTTISALLRTGNTGYLAHIGDSRIYLFRDGKLVQKTSDHTFVQRLVDSGRITPEEALVHPRRNVLMRVVGDVDVEPMLDFEKVELRAGDRWLLCSDGLSGYVPEVQMSHILQTTKSIDQANSKLINIALANGAPDNVTSIIVEVTTDEIPVRQTVIVGSAGDPDIKKGLPERKTFSFSSLLQSMKPSGPVEDYVTENQEDYLREIIAEDRRRDRFRKLRWMIALLIALGAIAAGLWFGYQWTQTQYYVGVSDGHVAIYQGIHQQVGPISLSEVLQVTDIEITSLPPYRQTQVIQTITADDLKNAQDIVRQLSSDANDTQ